MEEREIVLNGITIYLTRKKIKNLYIRIKPPKARVMVSVPVHTSDSVIAEFLEEHWSWIIEKRQEILDSEETKKEEAEYLTGERHALWGQWYDLQVERSLKRPLTELRGNRIYMRVGAHSTAEERRKQLDRWYREQLCEVLPGLIHQCEERVGRSANEWRFRRMKTRWGTCSIQRKRIWLNIQLAEMPPECLEYVVTHELTHLHEASHNKRFWSLMDSFYPDWRRAKQLLKERNR